MDWIITRVKEPSTWASLAALLVGFGVSIPDALWQSITMTGVGIAGILGFVLSEKAKPEDK